MATTKKPEAAKAKANGTKTATMELCNRAVQMNKDGEKMSAIIKRTGMNYSQVWGAIFYEKVKAENGKPGFVPEAQRNGQKIAQMRNSQGMSWGEIMVRCGWHPAKPSEFTLGRVTKLYKEATGTTHEGSRIGHGGAFLLGDVGKALYRGGNRQKTGIEIPAGMSRAQILEEIGKGLDERLTRLTTSGKITKAQAATRKANAMATANKALDEAQRAANPVKKAAKKAPAKAKKVASKATAKKAAAPTLAK